MHESLSGEELEGDGDLDAWVAEPFTETTSDKDKCGMVEFLKPDVLVMFDDIRFVETEVDTIWFADVVVFIRVD